MAMYSLFKCYVTVQMHKTINIRLKNRCHPKPVHSRNLMTLSLQCGIQTQLPYTTSILIIGKGFAYMCIMNILRPVVNQGEQRKWGMCVWIYMDRKSQLSEEFPAEYLQTTIPQEVNTNSIYRPRPVFSAKRGIPGLESRSSKTIYVCLIENKRQNI